MTARMRVAIIAASRRYVGGQSVQAELLTRNWEGDPDVEVRFIAIDPGLPRWLSWVERIPYLRTLARQPFYWAALWHGLRDVEIAHIFSASYWSFLLAPVPAWLMARLRRKRTLINYHSGEARDHLRRSLTAVVVLQHTDQLVVPSLYLINVLREFGLLARCVPNIFDSGQFRYRPRQPLRPRLVCTRGFHPYYRVDLVVRAFAGVKQEFPEASLCLVGKGPEEGAIRDLCSQMNLADIEFAGAVPHRGMSRFYEQADIFVNASCLDNMPISILEAFASGTPVVSTAQEGIRYMIEHERTGLLCETGDWHGLTENVARLLREPVLASQIARNALEESNRYRWNVVRGKWLEVYQALEQSSVVTHDSEKMVAADAK